MKRLILISTTALIFAVLFAFGDSEIEKKQYGSTMPGQTYFVSWSNVAAVSSVVYTNNEIEMWYPTKVKIWFIDPIVATSTLDHVSVISTFWYPTNTITTNASGTTTTNTWHGSITNTTYTYVTNRLCTITNTSGAIGQWPLDANTKAKLEDQYIQKGDILIWTLGQTNNVILGIVGKR